MVKPNNPHHETDPRGLKKLFTQPKKKRRDHPHHKNPETELSISQKEWENALCSVCLEFPHNSVLLLCSSFEKGCRPYMCGTGPLFSNCLEQYKRAYAEIDDDQDHHLKEESSRPLDRPNLHLLCPLCRGPVKGWTVVESARAHFNRKRRNCVQDDCSFVGTYEDIERHVESEHPLARPREVDPTRVEKWKKLESERDMSDVMSAVRSAMPGGIVMGDYVVETGFFGGGLFRLGGPEFSDGPTMDGGYFQVREAPFGSRSRRRGVSRVARLHERLLFGRQMGRW